MRILSSRQEPRSDSSHTPKTTIFRIRRDQFTPCRRSGLTVVCRILGPGRLQIGYVIATTSPNSQKPALEGSSGAAQMRNAPTWNGPPVMRCSPKQIRWNPLSISALQGGPAKPMSVSRCVVIKQVLHKHCTHNRCSATRRATGHQVIVSVRIC